MVSKHGHLVGDMKWLVPRYSRDPGKLIVLGAILANPEEPETSLTRLSGSIPIDEKLKEDCTRSVRNEVSSKLSTNTGGILKAVAPDNPLFSAAASIDAHSNTDSETVVEAMDVQAEIFYPDDNYMTKVLEKPEVVAFIKKHTWSASLYMITGVATAASLSVKENTTDDKGASMSLEVSGGGAGGELGAHHGTIASSGSSLTTNLVSDFAYRVREFEYRRFSGNLKDKGDVTTAALFSDERITASEEVRDEIPIFDGWADEDEESQDLLCWMI